MATDADYPWKMTGDPWLDGAIYARGFKKSMNRVGLRLNDCPDRISQRFEEVAKRQGCTTDWSETPNALTRSSDFSLILNHAQPVFRDLPEFRERRLIPEQMPRPFLEGYFIVASTILGADSVEGSSPLRPDYIRISAWRAGAPINDILEALGILGVHEYEGGNSSVFLSRENYRAVDCFEMLFRECKAEADELLRLTGGRTPLDYILENHATDPKRRALGKVVESVGARREAAETRLRRIRGAKGRSGAARIPRGEVRSMNADERQFTLEYATLNPDDVGAEDYNIREDGLKRLIARYDAILGDYFPFTLEFDALRELARGILDGESNSHGQTATETNVEALLPMRPRTRPHQTCLFFATDIVPEWFSRPASGQLRLRELAEIVGARGKEFQRDRVLGRISKKAGDAYERLGGFTFGSSKADLPTEVLLGCASCGELLVLSSGKQCAACGTGLCAQCARTFEQDDPNSSIFAAENTTHYCMVHSPTRALAQGRQSEVFAPKADSSPSVPTIPRARKGKLPKWLKAKARAADRSG